MCTKLDGGIDKLCRDDFELLSYSAFIFGRHFYFRCFSGLFAMNGGNFTHQSFTALEIRPLRSFNLITVFSPFLTDMLYFCTWNHGG